MEIHAIKTPIIKPKDDLVDVFLESLLEKGLVLKPRDVIIIAETVMATAQGRIINLNDIADIPENARLIAKRFEMDERVVKIVIDEA